MKIVLTLLLGLLTTTVFSQTLMVKISGSFFNTTSKEIKLSYANSNGTFEDFGNASLTKDGKFEMQTKVPRADYDQHPAKRAAANSGQTPCARRLPARPRSIALPDCAVE